MGNLCYAREHSVQFFFFTQFNLGYMGPLMANSEELFASTECHTRCPMKLCRCNEVRPYT